VSGLTPVPPGEVAAIVTTLEMRERPALSAPPASALRLVRWERPDAGRYRALFRRVGEPWLWFSRLVIDEAALLAIITDPDVHVFAVEDAGGDAVGILELDFRHEGACELGYFGLAPGFEGRGHGRWLMAEALIRAWVPGVARVWVHTCSLDHPSALSFYRRHGFTAIHRAVETFPDPRILGVLPREAAPQIPLLMPRN
jgi:GNAT superfamily N-acetyltransferase